jgi:hypothetical protein
MTDMQITPPPMPEPEGTFVVLGRSEAWDERTGQFTADQLHARDAQWLAIVKEAVLAEREACAAECESRHANTNYRHDTRHECAAAIRSRSTT